MRSKNVTRRDRRKLIMQTIVNKENKNMSNTLSCKNVVKAYGKNEVLHDLNLELEKGKI